MFYVSKQKQVQQIWRTKQISRTYFNSDLDKHLTLVASLRPHQFCSHYGDYGTQYIYSLVFQLLDG